MKLYENGINHFGTTYDLNHEPNLDEIKSLYKVPLPDNLKDIRLKEWEAFQIIADNFFIIGAVYNAKFASKFVCSVYDHKKKKLFDFMQQKSPSSVRVANGLNNTKSIYKSKDRWMVIRNQEFSNEFDIRVSHEKMKIKGVGRLEDLPLTIYYPFKGNRGLYSSKMVMPFEGNILINEESHKLKNAFLIIDDHKGYYPRHQVYQWATAGNRSGNEVTAFNFTHNQLENPNVNNENVLWHEGKIHHYGIVDFYMEKDHWTIRDRDEKVDLTFRIAEDYHLKQNLGPLKVNYRSPFGWFEGKITLEDGSILNVEKWFGMTEDIHNVI
jgi:hypothetical protein